jgi:hypothetical protein
MSTRQPPSVFNFSYNAPPHAPLRFSWAQLDVGYALRADGLVKQTCALRLPKVSSQYGSNFYCFDPSRSDNLRLLDLSAAGQTLINDTFARQAVAINGQAARLLSAMHAQMDHQGYFVSWFNCALEVPNKFIHANVNFRVSDDQEKEELRGWHLLCGGPISVQDLAPGSEFPGWREPMAQIGTYFDDDIEETLTQNRAELDVLYEQIVDNGR